MRGSAFSLARCSRSVSIAHRRSFKRSRNLRCFLVAACVSSSQPHRPPIRIKALTCRTPASASRAPGTIGAPEELRYPSRVQWPLQDMWFPASPTRHGTRLCSIGRPIPRWGTVASCIGRNGSRGTWLTLRASVLAGARLARAGSERIQATWLCTRAWAASHFPLDSHAKTRSISNGSRSRIT